MHYCWEGGTIQEGSQDVDLFSSEEMFEQYLELALLMAPGDSKLCGLEGFGSEAPLIELASNGTFTNL